MSTFVEAFRPFLKHLWLLHKGQEVTFVPNISKLSAELISPENTILFFIFVILKEAKLN